MSSRRRVEACDSWRPPRSHAGAGPQPVLLRAGPRLPAFASLSVREGGEAAAVAKAVDEAVVAPAGEGTEERRAAGGEEAGGEKERRRLPPAAQLVRHPLALLALVPRGAALFAAGAAAGAAAKTVTAPLDRVKILMQVWFLARPLTAAVRACGLTGFSLLCSPLQTHSVRVAGESAKKAVGFLEVTMRSVASLSSI